jgi:capsule polysaccharide export protein KpsE/RkpR
MMVWPKHYQSTVRIMPPTSTSSSAVAAAMGMAGSAGLGALAGDTFGLKTTGSLYLSILRSRNVQDAIIQRFELQEVYRDKYMYEARRDLDQRTASDEDHKSGVITIIVTDRSPQRAAKIANSYIDELNRVSTESNTSAAHRERIFLDQRLAEVSHDLDAASRKLADFSSQNLTMDIKSQGQATVEAGAILQGKMIAAESELRGLQQIYSQENPRVRSAEAAVMEMRRQLKAMGRTDGSANDDQIYPSLRQLPLLGVQYANLYRHVTVQETVFEMLTRQDELAKVDEAKELPVLRVLDTADIPERHSSPKRMTVIALSFVLSTGVGVLAILFSAYWEALDELDRKKMLFSELMGYAGQIGASKTFRVFRKQS